MPRLLLAAIAAALSTLALATAASAECPVTGCTGSYTAPNTTITEGPSGTIPDPRPVFRFTSSLAASHFYCRWGGEGAAWFACTSPYTAPAQADGEHRFSVMACKTYLDPEIGDLDVCDQTPASRTYWLLQTPPLPYFAEGPADGARVNTAPRYRFAGAGNPFDPRYECAIDGGDLHACSTTTTFLIDELAQGPHTVRVRAQDEFGRWSQTVSRTFVLDTVAPQITLSDPGATRDSTPTLTWSAPGDGGAQYTVACTLDGAPIACANGTIIVGSPLADGEHTVTVAATDEAGNRGETSVTFTVDTVPPELRELTWNAQASTLSFSAGDDAATTCRVDDRAFVACASPWAPASLTPGAHTLTVRATDAAGNVSEERLDVEVPRPQADPGTRPGGGPPAGGGPTAGGPPVTTPAPAPVGTTATPRQSTASTATKSTTKKKTAKKKQQPACTTTKTSPAKKTKKGKKAKKARASAKKKPASSCAKAKKKPKKKSAGKRR
jgi:hypothetical protein